MDGYNHRISALHKARLMMLVGDFYFFLCDYAKSKENYNHALNLIMNDARLTTRHYLYCMFITCVKKIIQCCCKINNIE
jgi:hypothetical protein